MAKTQVLTLRVPSLKVTVPMAASTLPLDLVPMEGPAGEPALEIVVGDGALKVLAKVNGKNLRKLYKTIAEHGPENVALALQGVLKPPATPGGPFILEGAGFQGVVKAPKPADPVAEGQGAG